jgi:hypothetical protein
MEKATTGSILDYLARGRAAAAMAFGDLCFIETSAAIVDRLAGAFARRNKLLLTINGRRVVGELPPRLDNATLPFRISAQPKSRLWLLLCAPPNRSSPHADLNPIGPRSAD